MINYIIFFIIFIIFLFYNYNNNIKENFKEYSKDDLKILKKINKRKVTMDDLIKADEYALKKICRLKNYGYDKKLNSCIHITEKTCIEDHPGIIANPEDIKKMEKIRLTGCKPQLDAFEENITRVGVSEWYKPTKEDLDNLQKEKKNVENLKNIWEKNGKKLDDYAKYLKADGKLQIAERNAKSHCRIPDVMFRNYCNDQNLKYVPDKSGVGKCIITPTYCKSKLMLYDKKKKECKPKDKVAEFIFGKTVTRGVQNLGSASSCPQKCKKDAWCAGLNICKPITNPGQSCWSQKHQSCWCQSKCKTPMNKQAAIATVTAIGSALATYITYATVSLACGSVMAASGPGAALVAAGCWSALGGIGVLVGSAGATATAALSLEAGRCSAGKDGLTLVGGKNGNKHYIHIHEPGCNAAYTCPDHPDNSYYCPGGIYPKCKPARNPGDDCITGIHNWCKGYSKCLPVVRPLAIAAAVATGPIIGSAIAAGSTLAGKCSAGKDGIHQVGKRYKYIPKLKKGNENPAITNVLKKFDKIRKENFPNDESTSVMDRPPNFDEPKDKILIADNGNKHYMKLGLSGCGIEMPCPPNYYCPAGAGPCKPAKGPGKYCLYDNWCRGESKCLPNSKCSAGKDGINPPGKLYFTDKKHKNITDEDFIYYESNNKKVWTEKRALIYDNGGGRGNVPIFSIGCGVTAPTPDGYYCKSAFNTPQKAKTPGSSCLFGIHKQCRGKSKCIATVVGERCTAGEDGENVPGKLTNHDIPEDGYIYRYWPKGTKNKIKLRVRLSWLHPPKILSNQPERHFLPLRRKGCSIVAKCPDKVKYTNEYGEKEITHTYCKNGFVNCKYPKSAGRGCTHFAGLGNKECKEKRCKGGTCSTKIGNKWYVPIDGRCGKSKLDFVLGMETDNCEPDTYCKKGSNGFGNCTFGYG